jgi:hypothetical protein
LYEADVPVRLVFEGSWNDFTPAPLLKKERGALRRGEGFLRDSVSAVDLTPAPLLKKERGAVRRGEDLK